jgi:iron(III) transport system ATP-binding protein
MISIENLSYSIDKDILTNIKLVVGKGEIHGIVGVSGAGKSTLLKLIGGLIDYSEGIIRFENKKIIGPSEKLIPGYENLQIVNQDFALDMHHSVRENIRVQG